MKQYENIMVPVAISEYIKEHEKQASLPILSTSGLVNQMFFFDTKGYEEKGYKALQKQSNVIVLTIEEALEMWNAGRTVGQQEITRENLSKVTAPHFREYLTSKGITL